MEKKKNLDLTRGDPMKLMILFALPMFIGALFELLYSTVDSATLGRFVGKNALAAVGATTSTLSLVMMLGNALTNGISVQVSQAWGARREDSLKRIVGTGCTLALSVGVLVAVLALTVSRPVLRLLGTPDAILSDAVLYLTIVAGLYSGQLLYNASASALRAIGDSRTPLIFLVFCSLLNVTLDLFFVLGLKGGVAGVAWATVIAQWVSAAACTFYMFRKYPVLRFSLKELKPDRAVLGGFARISLPMFLQSALLSLGMMAITYVINSFGEDIVAAYSVGSKTEQTVTVLFSQLAFSFSIFAGQNYGAKNYDRIRLGMRKALLLLAGPVALAMVLLLGFGDKLVLLFIDPMETAAMTAAVRMVHIEGCFLPALASIWLVNSCLRGMGHIPPTIVSSMLELGSKIGLSFALSALLGYVGIWYAAPLGWVIGLVPGVLFYFFGRWKEKALKKDAEEAVKQG